MCTCLLIFGFETKKCIYFNRITVRPLKFKFKLNQNCQSVQNNRPIRLSQRCTQLKSPGDRILCVLYLHYNVAFTFK